MGGRGWLWEMYYSKLKDKKRYRVSRDYNMYVIRYDTITETFCRSGSVTSLSMRAPLEPLRVFRIRDIWVQN